MIDEYDLSPLQLDALREIGNIGAGNSATALSQIINKKIDMQVPKVAFVPIEDVPDPVKIDWRPRCHCRGYREGDFCAFMAKPRQYSVRYAPRTCKTETGCRFGARTRHNSNAKFFPSARTYGNWQHTEREFLAHI